MVFLIESREEIALATLGDAVLEAFRELNRGEKTDFRTQLIDPVAGKSTRDYDEWVVGKFEYEHGRGPDPLRTYDSVMAYRIKSISGIFSRDFALSLFQKGIRPSLVVIPGLGETCPVGQKGIFYMNPTNEGKFGAYLVGRSIGRIPEVDRVWHCCLNPGGMPEPTSVK